MNPSNRTFPKGNGRNNDVRKSNGSASFSDDDDINLDEFNWSAPVQHPAPRILSEGYNTEVEAGDAILLVPTYTPERLKTLRTSLGMTAQQFGIAVGYAPSSAKVRISELEHGRQAIPQPVSIIAAYLEQYGVLKPFKMEMAD